MRRLVALALSAVTALILATSLAAPPAPDGPLRVVTDDPVRVVIPLNASVATVTAATVEAVEAAAAAAASPEMRSELVALSGNAAAIRHIAGTGHRSISSGTAAAVAFPWFRVDAGGDRLTIYSVTVELIPGSPAIAVSRDHEDGHSEVNDQLALRCGSSIARDAIAAGHRGARLELEITDRLQTLADRAHETYHRLATAARLGTHLGHARDAASQVAAAGCA